MRYPVFLMLFVLAAFGLHGQSTVTISDEVSLNEQKQFFLLGKYGDNVLMFTEKNDSWELYTFDKAMHLKSKRDIEPERKSTEVIGVVASKTDFTVLYKFQYKGALVVKVGKYDSGGQLLDSLTLQNYGNRLSQPKVAIAWSENERYFLVWIKEQEKNLRLLRFDTYTMKLMPEVSLILDRPEDDDAFNEITIDNEGTIYVINARNARFEERHSHHFEVTTCTPDGTINQVVIPMANQLTHAVKFVYDNLNRCLTGAGLYVADVETRAKGYFYLQLRPGDKEAKVLSGVFDEVFSSSFSGKRNAEKGLLNVDINSIILRRDGGAIMLLEEQRETYRNDHRAFDMGGGSIVTDYYYDNMAAFSIHPDGKKHFSTVMFKRQYSFDDDGLYSSFFTQQTPTLARLIFNDEVKSRTTVSEYTLDGEGRSDRKTLFSTDKYNVSLSFRNALQTGAKEVIVPSINRGQLKLVRISG